MVSAMWNRIVLGAQVDHDRKLVVNSAELQSCNEYFHTVECVCHLDDDLTT